MYLHFFSSEAAVGAAAALLQPTVAAPRTRDCFRGAAYPRLKHGRDGHHTVHHL